MRFHTAQQYHPPCASPAQHEAQQAQQDANDAALERARQDWLRWFAKGDAAGDLACDLPECDGDAWEAVAGLIASGLREPWSSDNRKRAEEVVDALARVEADRSALA